MTVSKGVIIEYNKASTPAIIFFWGGKLDSEIVTFFFFLKLAFGGRHTLFGVRVITKISHEDIKNHCIKDLKYYGKTTSDAQNEMIWYLHKN